MSFERLVPLGVLALIAPAVALAEGPAKKTLAECIAIALAQQPTLKAASASVEAARERVWESRAAYLPQVGASYSATRRHASAGSLTGSSFGGARAATFNFWPSRRCCSTSGRTSRSSMRSEERRVGKERR